MVFSDLFWFPYECREMATNGSVGMHRVSFFLSPCQEGRDVLLSMLGPPI